mmetsp:Transcript_51027/g.136091  ORF Transcript_51027/g.136091 Transcript_51027/m.136091 type:complete len:107 (+) Transcript_51027:34-354(+)
MNLENRSFANDTNKPCTGVLNNPFDPAGKKGTSPIQKELKANSNSHTKLTGHPHLSGKRSYQVEWLEPRRTWTASWQRPSIGPVDSPTSNNTRAAVTQEPKATSCP